MLGRAADEAPTPIRAAGEAAAPVARFGVAYFTDSTLAVCIQHDEHSLVLAIARPSCLSKIN